MKPSAVISDSSCLIGLRDAGHLDLLQRLFERVVIPPAVAEEVGIPPPHWFFIVAPTDPLAVAKLEEHLDPGESEAIALALELSLLVILDDRPARNEAVRRGLKIVGLGGILLLAKRSGEIDAIRPLLDKAQDTGFRVGERLRRDLLARAGETDEGA